MWQTLPGPSSSQDKSNSIACKNTSQAGKVRMAICWFLKHTLIQLQLQKKQSTAKRRWRNKWDKNECTDVERQEIRKTTKYQAEGGSERRGGGGFYTHSTFWPCLPFSPVWAGFVWRKPFGDRQDGGVWKSSFACWASLRFLWVQDHLLCATAQAASAHALHFLPTYAPTTEKAAQIF